MKELLKLPYYLTLALFLGLTACGDDDDDDDVDCDELAMTLEAEGENIGTAFANVLTEASEENCEAFIDALEDYLNIIDQSRSCLSQSDQDELDQAIEDFEAIRDDSDCSN